MTKNLQMKKKKKFYYNISHNLLLIEVKKKLIINPQKDYIMPYERLKIKC